MNWRLTFNTNQELQTKENYGKRNTQISVASKRGGKTVSATQ